MSAREHWMPELGEATRTKRLNKNQALSLLAELFDTLDGITFRKGAYSLKITNITLYSFFPRFCLKFNLRLRKTRGLVQFSTSGDARGCFELVWSDAPAVCVKNFEITQLNLRRIPNWLDNTWIKDRINEKLPSLVCIDLTPA